MVRGWSWYVLITFSFQGHSLDYSIEYFEAVADAILSAKSEIYIEDWWLVRITLHVITGFANLTFSAIILFQTRLHNWYVQRCMIDDDYIRGLTYNASYSIYGGLQKGMKNIELIEYSREKLN